MPLCTLSFPDHKKRHESFQLIWRNYKWLGRINLTKIAYLQKKTRCRMVHYNKYNSFLKFKTLFNILSQQVLSWKVFAKIIILNRKIKARQRKAKTDKIEGLKELHNLKGMSHFSLHIIKDTYLKQMQCFI